MAAKSTRTPKPLPPDVIRERAVQRLDAATTETGLPKGFRVLAGHHGGAGLVQRLVADASDATKAQRITARGAALPPIF